MREMQCRRGGKSKLGENSGNGAGLINQREDRCGGKIIIIIIFSLQVSLTYENHIKALVLN